ncbi:MAG TPA: SPOR domain-containing protein [Methylibium sp.]|uniref:SPOR domain-containing protein n=1 Tax=Methylibium sp. TaxID=2067992 RepID=UPI002DBE5087|nr:SPOR domain-containing protein [Methylibium sp.]HEU4460371.1 SPOR domain-containing protein [Methylibium sp.]
MRSRTKIGQGQAGGFLVGAVIGLLVGLALALGVALYVTKVPVPFINKVPQRTAEQDAAEAEKNRKWDPNTPLHGRNPAASAAGSTAPAGVVLPPPAPDAQRSATLGAPAKPGSDLSTTGAGAVDGAFVYFVQAGAYSRTEEAEAQRAKLAIQGFESKITEREQSGRIMYRVRIGPFAQRLDAEKVKDTLDGAGTVAALVRVQK